MVLSKQHSASPDEILAEKLFFFGKRHLFLSLWDIEKKYIGFWQHLSGRNVKIIFYLSLGNVWGYFLFGTINLIFHLRTLSELFLSICWKNVGPGSHNYNLHVQRKILMETWFFSTKLLFLSFSDIYRCSSAFWQIYLAGLSKMQSSCPQKHSEKKSFSGKPIFHHFYHIFTKNFSADCRFVPECVVKAAFCLYRRMFWVRKNKKCIFFQLFRTLSCFFPGLFSKLCQWCCQNWTLHPHGNVLWKNNFFLKKLQFYVIVAHWKKKDWILSKLFWLECQICILPVHWNILRRKVFVGK